MGGGCGTWEVLCVRCEVLGVMREVGGGLWGVGCGRCDVGGVRCYV